MISALMKYDYGTLKDCLDSIEVSMLKILKNSKFSDTEELDVSNHLFFDHILRVGEIAIDRNDEASVSLILNSLSTIGLKAANLNYSFFSGQSVRAIGQIGEKAAAKNDKSILRESRNYLNCVGERFIDKELKYPIDMVFLYNRTITETALKENIDNARYQDGLTESEIKFNYNILLEALLFIDNIGYKLRQNNKNKIYDLTVELSCIQHLNKKFNQNNERFDWIERMIEESLQKYSN
ncbi:MAG: hypothetical protein APG12_01544 [Candidatus Methanofastidiosum methylothiophilum]|jgi:hypothetical protein|uniref:Uncharacterized protein n=1 Tax=Candidatus Methanofastidiosum methylothiophilum TaxID=1705564 RepID=A0A150III3_9EURY|nr:MAG: hypothetical protein APG10_01380 [Candidatus Methanofastidiosum methylthiophilus]KYC49348.1 MAG: hypothetical protein APG12_01544 [Candidatus Methanofastidiosum methylthiophilus]